MSVEITNPHMDVPQGTFSLPQGTLSAASGIHLVAGSIHLVRLQAARRARAMDNPWKSPTGEARVNVMSS